MFKTYKIQLVKKTLAFKVQFQTAVSARYIKLIFTSHLAKREGKEVGVAFFESFFGKLD